jgi:hypothetical protein
LKNGVLKDTLHWLSPDIRVFRIRKSTEVDTFVGKVIMCWLGIIMIMVCHKKNCIRLTGAVHYFYDTFQLAECHIFSIKVVLPCVKVFVLTQ